MNLTKTKLLNSYRFETNLKIKKQFAATKNYNHISSIEKSLLPISYLNKTVFLNTFTLIEITVH